MTKHFGPRRLAVVLGGMLALFVGCNDGPPTGEVSGLVTVNGAIPANGSSITFIPLDGKAPSAGNTLKEGKYSVKVPVGTAKVELRVPRPVARRKDGAKDGPGPGGDLIEESLPAEYNNNTTLRFDVQPGKQEKNWDVQLPKK